MVKLIARFTKDIIKSSQ